MSDAESGDALSAFQPHLRHYALQAELALAAEAVGTSGLHVLPRSDDPFCWDAICFVRQGPYRFSVIKFKLIIPSDFPGTSPPIVYFRSRLFHPAIDAEGRLQLDGSFATWRPGVDHLVDVLNFVVNSIENVSVEGAVNEEAARLLQDDPAAFQRRVDDCVRECDTELYTAPDDDFEIKLSRWQAIDHAEVTDKLVSGTASVPDVPGNKPPRGYSFVAPGSWQPLSQEQPRAGNPVTGAAEAGSASAGSASAKQAQTA